MGKDYVLCRRDVSGPLEEVPRYCNKAIKSKNVFDFCEEDLARMRNLWPKNEDGTARTPERGRNG